MQYVKIGSKLLVVFEIHAFVCAQMQLTYASRIFGIVVMFALQKKKNKKKTAVAWM